MDNLNPSPAKYDNHFKWGGAALFMAVVALAGYTIYQASTNTQPETVTTTVTTPSATPSTADTAAKGSPAPAVVTNSTDLTTADKALDSSDIDSFNTDLNQNDTDLASF